MYYPDSGYRTTLNITNINLRKDLPTSKIKYFSIYRGIENDPNMVTSFALVNRFPVMKTSSDYFSIKFTDYGESDASITPPMDRSFFIETPSIADFASDTELSTYSPSKIVSAAFYQSRLFVALTKSSNFNNEASTPNTIIASKLNAPEQLAIPVVT